MHFFCFVVTFIAPFFLVNFVFEEMLELEIGIQSTTFQNPGKGIVA